MPTVRARDGCVVETAGLAAMLRSFVDDWQRSRPSTAGQFSSSEPCEQESAMSWLVASTGVPEETLGNILRDPPRYRTTELWIADRVVSALDEPQAFHDGRLVVRGNSLARLRIAPTRPVGRLSYNALIEFAGHPVGRVHRTPRTGYRAYMGAQLVAESTSLAMLRRELHSRVPDATCCGGSSPNSLTGVVEPF